jgi:hypothetical protein
MRNLRVFVRNAAIVTALSVTLSACVVYPARGYYIGGPVAVAPPPVQGTGTGWAAGTSGSVVTGRLRAPATVGSRITGSVSAMGGTCPEATGLIVKLRFFGPGQRPGPHRIAAAAGATSELACETF